MSSDCSPPGRWQTSGQYWRDRGRRVAPRVAVRRVRQDKIQQAQGVCGSLCGEVITVSLTFNARLFCLGAHVLRRVRPLSVLAPGHVQQGQSE